MKMPLLLKNADLVTQNADRAVLRGSLLVDDGRIIDIGPDLHYPDAEEIDLSGLTVIPGLIQSHIHLCQALFRNLADDLELLDWLRRYIWPLEKAHTPDSLRASARLGLHELLASGVTTVLDMGCMHHMPVVFE